MISTDFLITALVVVLIPGTGVLFTISTGLFAGRLAALYAALGCTAGILPHLLATAAGLAALLHTSAPAFQALKFAGVAYLLFLAYATWRDTTAFEPARNAAATPGAIMLRAFLLNILNPKLTLFFLAFLPQFVAADSATPLADLTLLSAVFMAMTFIVFVIYGLLAHGFRRLVINSRRVQHALRRSFAGAFAVLGAKLAFSER